MSTQWVRIHRKNIVETHQHIHTPTNNPNSVCDTKEKKKIFFSSTEAEKKKFSSRIEVERQKKIGKNKFVEIWQTLQHQKVIEIDNE